MRVDGRRDDQMRPISFQRAYTEQPAGSVLASFGRTRVLCTAMVEDGVPHWLMNSGKGWVTGEYAMLPGSTQSRKPREARIGKTDSRGLEISRLIGRCLRAVVDLRAFPDRTVWVDCDVLQADGGTRTVAISGAFLALKDAFETLKTRRPPLRTDLAAVSAGVVDGRAVLDLDYREDAAAAVDLNVVMTGEGEFVEIQGSAETEPFGRELLDRMLELARQGIDRIVAEQRNAFAS